jgi:hypothetical protein
MATRDQCRARPSKMPQAWRSPPERGPVNEHESKRDQGINTADAEAGEEKLEGYAHRRCACSGSGHAALRADSLIAEVDVLDEHYLAVIIFDDVVAAEPIAVLIEIVGAFGTLVALHAQNCLTDLLRINTLSVFDRER